MYSIQVATTCKCEKCGQDFGYDWDAYSRHQRWYKGRDCRIFRQPRFASNVLRKPGTDCGLVIAPSSKEEGRVQITFFDARGFSSDYTVDDTLQAWRHAVTLGHTEEMDPAEFEALVMSEIFQAGSELTTLLNRERTADEELRFLELVSIINGRERSN